MNGRSQNGRFFFIDGILSSAWQCGHRTAPFVINSRQKGHIATFLALGDNGSTAGCSLLMP